MASIDFSFVYNILAQFDKPDFPQDFSDTHYVRQADCSHPKSKAVEVINTIDRNLPMRLFLLSESSLSDVWIVLRLPTAFKICIVFLEHR